MSKLTELLAELDKRRTEFDIGERASFSVNASEYDLLRPALRERDGMALVPREPTDVMLRAGWNAYVDDMKGGLERFAITYRAMLAAAEGK